MLEAAPVENVLVLPLPPPPWEYRFSGRIALSPLASPIRPHPFPISSRISYRSAMGLNAASTRRRREASMADGYRPENLNHKVDQDQFWVPPGLPLVMAMCMEAGMLAISNSVWRLKP